MQKIIIIGATSGIGRALAEIYLSNNCMVGITGRRQHLLDELKTTNSNLVRTACFDVKADQNIAHLSRLIEEMNGVDLFIYNAGIGSVSEQLDWQKDKDTYETNVKGFIEMTNYMFNYFIGQGHGHIAATSSVASQRGNSFAPAYSASKAFMSVYMEGLHMKARRLKANIHITDIQPGFVNTRDSQENARFWVVPVNRAAILMESAISRKKWRAYVPSRWWLVAQLMKNVPGWVYHRIG